MNDFDYKLLLGSGSPRRRELLRMMDIDFEVIKLMDVDETYPPSLPVEQVPEFLSKVKGDAYVSQLQPGQLLLTADTVVICQGIILGKPVDDQDACRMLKMLSSSEHRVITGVTLSTIEKSHTFSETTIVEFGHLTDNEIHEYVSRYQPLDKAGAYGIQEWIGAVGVKAINGCFYNVMGLPTARLYSELKRF